VDQAHQGDTIVIAKNGKPLARLVPLDQPARPKIVFGLMKGEFIEADDFDAPLPDDLQALFEGREPDAAAPPKQS
jgi:antitoxin (DNA-binding transcriptional repressor) of toxin-antitoxin stability system